MPSLVQQGRTAQLAGDWDVAIERYETALAAPGDDGDRGWVSEVKRWVGSIHRERGDLDLAAEWYAGALAAARDAERTGDVAAALNCQALVAQMRGETAAAESTFLQARRLAHAVGDERMAAIVDQNLGMLANVRGDHATAILNYGSALTRYRRLGDEHAQVWALNNLGMAHVDRDDERQAERCFDEALALARKVAAPDLVAKIELNRAELHLRRQQFEAARQCCDRSLVTYARLKSKPGQGEAYKFLGVMYRETTRPHLAEIHFGLALSLATQCRDLLLNAEVLREWARVHLDERRNREAVKLLNQARKLFDELGARLDIVDIERRTRQMQEAYLEAVATWGAEAIESKDPYTAGHSSRVAEYACKLGRALGITGWEMTSLEVGALVHDVGKTVIPAELLTKPASLDADEWEVMKQHPVVGEEIVDCLDFPFDIRPIVRSHHERWDGSGYPDGLKGDEIPLLARLVGLADTYDALTSSRSYRPAFAHDRAVEIMDEAAGRLFDPELYAIFKGILEEEVAGVVTA